jgi:hypothetical protein
MVEAASTPLEHLKGKLGVELYREVGRLRADDLLVRERVDRGLGEATTHIRNLKQRWQEERIGMPTREQPFPPAELMAPMRAAESILKQLESTATLVRGLPVLNVDKVWAKARSVGLNELLQFDWGLVGESEALSDEVSKVRSLDKLDRDAVEARLATMDGIAADRRHYIEIMA